jgi:hypothetical protein
MEDEERAIPFLGDAVVVDGGRGEGWMAAVGWRRRRSRRGGGAVTVDKARVGEGITARAGPGDAGGLGGGRGARRGGEGTLDVDANAPFLIE